MQSASRNLRVFFIVGAALLTVLGACDRPERKTEVETKAAPCTSVGQQCEFLPGKLGACVMPTGCSDNSCLICQSQH